MSPGLPAPRTTLLNVSPGLPAPRTTLPNVAPSLPAPRATLQTVSPQWNERFTRPIRAMNQPSTVGVAEHDVCSDCRATGCSCSSRSSCGRSHRGSGSNCVAELKSLDNVDVAGVVVLPLTNIQLCFLFFTGRADDGDKTRQLEDGGQPPASFSVCLDTEERGVVGLCRCLPAPCSPHEGLFRGALRHSGRSCVAKAVLRWESWLSVGLVVAGS